MKSEPSPTAPRENWRAAWKRERVLRLAVYAWTLAFLGVLVLAAIRPNEHSVFTDYWLAGGRWLLGERLYPYGNKFLYSPLAAAWFAAFAFMPLALSGVVWRILNVLAYSCAIGLGARAFWNEEGAARSLGYGMLALLPLSLSEWSNGQAGVLVAALIILSLVAAGDGRWQLVAAAIALSTALKIYPLALGLLLAVFYPRPLSWRLLVWLAGLFLLSLFLQHPRYAFAQYHNWLGRLGKDERRLAGPYGTWRDAWLLLRMIGVPLRIGAWSILQTATGLGAASFCVWGRRARWSKERSLIAVLVLGSVWMTLFGPATEAATYILLAPAVTFALITSCRQSSPVWLRAGMTTSYGMLLFADVCNSWIRPKHAVDLVHAIQPLAAVIFLLSAIAWLLADARWPASKIAFPENRLSRER